MRVLVTGGSGFVGSHLLKRLAAEGHEVTATGRTVPAGGGASSLRWESWDGGALSENLRARIQDADLVYHLVARTHVMEEREADPLQAYRQVNVEGTRHLIEAMHGKAKLVFLSSVKALAEATEPGHPLTDATEPRPTTPYGLTKLEAERLVAAALPGRFVILRPPLIYGPGVKANFLRLIGLAGKGWPLPLGSLRNRRSMVFTGNLVDALMKAGTEPSVAGGTFLITDGEDLSTAELVQRLATALGAKPRLFPFPTSVLRGAAAALGKGEEAGRLLGDLQLDAGGWGRAAGWTAPHTVDEALAATVDWYRSRRAQA